MRAFILSTLAACCIAQSGASAVTVDEFKQSWTARALKLQREIDLNTPLNEATFLGTHNSYNSSAYQTPYRYPDPNQKLSLYDQLEMGVRSIELDAHWSRTPTNRREILLCHSDPDHSECGLHDRPFTAGLAELRNWLLQNPGEVVLLYIERHLDGHDTELADELETYLGRYIFKPGLIRDNNLPAETCMPLPGTLTRADVIKAGRQLLIVTKFCEPGSQIWNDYGFAGIGMIPDRPFSFIDVVPDEFSPYPDCGKSIAFKPDINHSSLWRVYEDGTMGSSHRLRLDEKGMKDLVRCGINWQTMDQLSIADSRLDAAIWSWVRGYPQAGKGHCAYLQMNAGGIMNAGCDKHMSGFACRDEYTQEIKSVTAAAAWKSGEQACQQQAGNSWHFSMPVNGREFNVLKESARDKHIQAVWLNYLWGQA